MTPKTFHHAGLDWIPHTPGDPMPVHPCRLVTVRYRNGRMVGPLKASSVAWGKLKHESGSDVIEYIEETE